MLFEHEGLCSGLYQIDKGNMSTMWSGWRRDGAVNLQYEGFNTPGPYDKTISSMEIVPCCVHTKKLINATELPVLQVLVERSAELIASVITVFYHMQGASASSQCRLLACDFTNSNAFPVAQFLCGHHLSVSHPFALC